MEDTVELSLDRRSFKALVAMIERAGPRTSDEMAVYEMLQGEANDEETEEEEETEEDDDPEDSRFMYGNSEPW
jgi:hypothetical protein